MLLATGTASADQRQVAEGEFILRFREPSAVVQPEDEVLPADARPQVKIVTPAPRKPIETTPPARPTVSVAMKPRSEPESAEGVPTQLHVAPRIDLERPPARRLDGPVVKAAAIPETARRAFAQSDNAASAERIYPHDAADGVWIHRRAGGGIMCTGMIVDGLPSGKWKRWFAAGEAPMFDSANLRGFEAPYLAEAEFVDGALSGTWTVYDARHRMALRWHLTNGTLHGVAEWWYPSGERQEQMGFEDGAIHGDVYRWKPGGDLISKNTFIHGKKMAAVTNRFEGQGDVIESRGTQLQCEKLTQYDLDWWRGVARRVEIEIDPVEQHHGEWTWYYSNGRTKLVGEYDEGRPSGNFTRWYRNGQVHFTGEYVDGRRHGKFEFWHENGQKMQIAHFSHGSAVGTWMQWDEQGNLISKGDVALASLQVPTSAPVLPALVAGELEPEGPTVRISAKADSQRK